MKNVISFSAQVILETLIESMHCLLFQLSFIVTRIIFSERNEVRADDLSGPYICSDKLKKDLFGKTDKKQKIKERMDLLVSVTRLTSNSN